MNEPQANPDQPAELDVEGARPVVVETARGPVEYVAVGEGPTVLALHGAMGGHDQSLMLARTIGEPGYRYLAVSRPGYLGTPLSSGDTPEQQADLCAALLDELEIAETAVMAISGGGPCAFELARRHGSRCWALVLASTCAGRMTTRIPISFRVMTRLAQWPAFVRFLRNRTARDPEKAARPSIADPELLQRTVHDPVVGPLFAEMLVSTFDRMGERIAGTMADIEVTTNTETFPVDGIEVPTLVIHGTGDRLLPYAQHGKLLAERISGAELMAIEEGEHVSIFTHREEIRRRVTAFLRERRP